MSPNILGSILSNVDQNAANELCQERTHLRCYKDILLTGFILKQVATKISKLKMKCKTMLKQEQMKKIVNLLETGEKQWGCELLP